MYKKRNEKQICIPQQQTTTTEIQDPDLEQAHLYSMWRGQTIFFVS